MKKIFTFVVFSLLAGCNVNTATHIDNQELNGRFTSDADFKINGFNPPNGSVIKVLLRTELMGSARLYLQFSNQVLFLNVPAQAQDAQNPNGWTLSPELSGLKDWTVTIARSTEKLGPEITTGRIEYTRRSPAVYTKLIRVPMKDHFAIRFHSMDRFTPAVARIDVDSKPYQSTLVSEKISAEEFSRIPATQREFIDLAP